MVCFPDRLAIRGGKLAFFEIKTESDEVEPEQKKVVGRLRDLRFETHVWRYRKKEDDFVDDEGTY
jgi:hypothetical protein